jgi:hypothetical protein
LSIWLIAIVFVFNGAASLALVELPAVPALNAHEHHAEHAGRTADAAALDHDHDQDHAGNHKHNDNCLKCCGICNVANLIPDIAATPIMFTYASITFNIGQHDLVGFLVVLDPDIPKTVV